MADKIINVRIQQRYDTEANWKAKDPVLLKGEIVYTSDGTNIGKYKVGNGTSKWSALPYAKADLSKGDVTTALGYTPPTSNTWRGIQNNLTSNSTTDSLSAAQGKVLKGLVDGKAPTSHTHTIAQITNLQTTLDGKANNHSHPYLPTAGGTMSGTAYISWADSGNWSIGNKDVTFPVSRGGLSWIGQSDAIYFHAVETGNDNLELYLKFTDDNSNGLSIRNASDKQTARISATGNITATSFIGPLSGNANTATALTSSAGSTTQPIYFSGGKPVACTYTLGKSVPSNAVFTDTNTWRGIQNNLTSDSTSDSLSAAQGKVLKTLVDGKSANNHNHDSVYSKLGHTHSYLPLSGGTMTGTISSSLVTNTHIAGNKGTAIINSTASGTGYTMLAKMNSKNGVWTFGSYLTEFMLYYTANTTVSAGTNAPTYGVRLLDESGNTSFPGTVSAGTFSGPLSGNASTSTVATKLGRNGDTSTPMVFNWSGKDGQPSWLWGGSDGTNMYVYNPSNFSVKYATSAGSATNATYLNIVATNEIRFNKPSRTKKESLWFGYVWSDGSKSDLISTYCFGNGNGGYAQVTASQFNGSLNGNANTASSAAKWTTARTLSLTGSVTGSVTIDGSGNVSLATTTNHTHSSVNDSGDGGATTFAYSKSGMNYGDYSWLAGWNGKELRAVSKSQFATAGHTHNYAGSSSAGGSANSAVKLTTARSISIGGFSSGSASFDGSGNITIDNWGYGCKKYVTQNSTSAPYFRIAYCEDKSNYSDRSMIFVIDSGYSGGGFGIVKVAFRSNDISKEGQSNCELKWLVRQGFSANQLFIKGNAPAGESQYADLYFKATGTYQAISITVLSMGNRRSKIRVWTFEEGNTRANPDIRKYTYTVEGSDAGTANYANSAGAASVAYKLNNITADWHGQITTTSWFAAFNPSVDAQLRTISPANVKTVLGINNVNNTADANKSVKYATSAGSVAWGNVSGKPSTYTPSSHTHTKSQITDFPTSLPASDVYSWAKASTKPSYSWSEIGSKPSTFTPSSHDHTKLQGTMSSAAVPGKSSDGFMTYHYNVNNGLANNMPSTNNANAIITISRHGGDYTTQLGFSSNDNIYYRNGVGTTAWKKMLDSSNYTSYTVTKTGSGASGTWGINVTGSAGSVAWGNVSGRPSSMPASDVYSWAKASSKPSYSWSEISNKPSSMPASDVYAWAKASSKPSYAWGEIGNKPSYLLSNQIKRGANGGAWISARDNALVVGSGSSKDGWNPVVAQKTANGSWSIGNLNGNEHLSFSYTTDTDYNNGKNVATTINLPPTSGTLCLTNHTHPYLPTTGGTLNNGSTQCPLIITGAVNNESSITYKYKGQNSGGHWVVGQGAGTANIDTFSFYKNGAGTLATLMSDGQFRFNRVTFSGYQTKDYTSGAVGTIANDYTIRFRGGTDGYFITKGPSSLNFGYDKDMTVDGKSGTHSWGYTFRMQVKYCYCDVGFRSTWIYNNTISGSSNLNISSDGTIKRVSSAAKYKLDIQNINKPDTYAYNLLNLNPKQWFDKGETERYAKYLTAQYSGKKLRDEEESELLDGSINPYYGLIAEDVKAAGLDEFCIYGKADKNGKKELEGIQYDRLPILTIPILRDLVTCMQKILPSVEKNISDHTLLSEVKEIESRFNSFNPQNIVNKQYTN